MTFKSTETKSLALQHFKREPVASKFLRKLCCIKDQIMDNVAFDEQSLEVTETVEPDQILWRNMGRSK